MNTKNFFMSAVVASMLAFTGSANAYPVYAQNGYENPREATAVSYTHLTLPTIYSV